MKNMTKDLYVMQRTDTGEFYREPIIPFYCKWLHQGFDYWTENLSEAKLYSWDQIVSVARSYYRTCAIQIVRVEYRLVEAEVILSDIRILFNNKIG